MPIVERGIAAGSVNTTVPLAWLNALVESVSPPVTAPDPVVVPSEVACTPSQASHWSLGSVEMFTPPGGVVNANAIVTVVPATANAASLAMKNVSLNCGRLPNGCTSRVKSACWPLTEAASTWVAVATLKPTAPVIATDGEPTGTIARSQRAFTPLTVIVPSAEAAAVWIHLLPATVTGGSWIQPPPGAALAHTIGVDGNAAPWPSSVSVTVPAPATAASSSAVTYRKCSIGCPPPSAANDPAALPVAMSVWIA